LYRTEFLYLKGHLPAEEEQYENYLRVAKGVFPNPVVIRTLDLGGDKIPGLHNPDTAIPREANPFLGLRSVRFCLQHPDVFEIQLRAILRASAVGKIKILFPMISTVEELLTVKRIFVQVQEKMRLDKIEFNEKIEIGAMIEVPSAAIMVDVIAREVDFMSIGTNDLIQYTLAVDRSNENIAYLYEPRHPAIIRLIKNVVDTCHRLGKPVSLCGEMAADPRFTLLLLGLGLDELSVPPSSILRIKRIIRTLTLATAKEIAGQVVNASTLEEVNRILTSLKV
jgi:phosphotransferase system enzyme I (PtsI)